MNNKSQFFIFAAVLVLLSLLAIQYSLLSYREISQTVTDVPFSDIPFISNYIESSVRDTSNNAFNEIYRTGDLNLIHSAFSKIYSAHYEIEEKELNYYLSILDIGIEILESSNINFEDDIAVTGPSIFEVGNFNRKILINTSKIGIAPNRYTMQSDIGIFKVEPLNELLLQSQSNPYVLKIDLNNNGIYESNEILYKDSNYSSNTRLTFNGRIYTIGESRITYGGLQSIEKRMSFLEDFYAEVGNDGKNFVQFYYSNGNPITVDGVSKFYIGDVFLFQDYLLKVSEIVYFPNGQKDDFLKFYTLNVQISLQESEKRREWFDPNENPGLRYGLVDLTVYKENALKTSTIQTGDRIIVSSLMHNDLEGNITDLDLLGRDELGSTLTIWEIVNVILSNAEGIFFSEGSQYKVEVDIASEEIEAFYEWNGANWILIDINACERDALGNLYCFDAYPLVEGDSFYLGGEEYVVKDISNTAVSFLRSSLNLLDISINVDEDLNPLQSYKPDYGVFSIGGRSYRIYVKKNINGYVIPADDDYVIIIDPQTAGENIYLKIGDPFVLEDYALVFDSMNFLNKDEAWHVFLRYFDMASDKKEFTMGNTRVLFGWDNNNFDYVDTWTYSQNIDGNITITHKNLSTEKIKVNNLITDNGILAYFPEYDSVSFFEYDMFYPADGDNIYLSEYLTEVTVDVFNQDVTILIDDDRDGDLSNNSGDYIYPLGGDSRYMVPGDIFYSGGVGFQIVSIIPYHDDGDANTWFNNPVGNDEIGRVLIKKVPYYQYTPILYRLDRNDITEFTSILSNYKFYVRRPGDYLVVFTYSFEIDGIKKETSQYYNFKVYQ